MSENQFATINQSPKNNVQNNERRNSYKRTQTLRRNTSVYSSTQPITEKDKHHGKSSDKNKRKIRPNLDCASSSISRGKSGNVGKKIYQWCAQCCGKKKSKIAKMRRSKRNFFKRLRKKKKKRTTFSTEPSIATIEHTDSTDPMVRKHRADETVDRFESSKERRKRMKKRKRKTHASETSVRTFGEDQDEEELIKDIVPQMDFTKSCCYLCAKNTMAIAAAISNKADKLHMSVQASTKERLTSDKSCSPEIHVRTVQSSVKVKMRDMSTLHPEKRKDKKKRAKLNLKKLNNIIPRIKFPMYPKMRTVACETDKSMRCNNMPRCRAMRGTHCITETNLTENDRTPENVR
ncbi:hypothetical protein ANTRET_LOCUS2396 [Anthophora retusa]